MTDKPIRLLFLTGPTASGKSRLSVPLARRLDAEILSLDSMAVYRGMDIGTDKPPIEAREAVPHHLIDICEPSESFSTGRYVAAAEEAIAGIRARGRLPLFTGGTALYIKTLTEGLFEGPEADWDLRDRLNEEAREHGGRALHERLAQIDPDYAAKIHPNDLRRVVRGIEVYQKTGRPISEQHKQFGSRAEQYDSRIVCIRRDRAELVERIDRRVERMFRRGLVEEVSKLAEAGMSREARQALGYRQVLRLLEGEIDLDETIRLTQRDTRRFAKRQMTWFRGIDGVRWLDANGADIEELVAEAAGLLDMPAPGDGAE